MVGGAEERQRLVQLARAPVPLLGAGVGRSPRGRVIAPEEAPTNSPEAVHDLGQRCIIQGWVEMLRWCREGEREVRVRAQSRNQRFTRASHTTPENTFLYRYRSKAALSISKTLRDTANHITPSGMTPPALRCVKPGAAQSSCEPCSCGGHGSISVANRDSKSSFSRSPRTGQWSPSVARRAWGRDIVRTHLMMRAFLACTLPLFGAPTDWRSASSSLALSESSPAISGMAEEDFSG